MESELIDDFQEGIVLNTTPHNHRVAAKAASFTINGKRYDVSSLPGNTTLNLFIREHAHLRGTKYMCQEGGCGACVVAVTASDNSSKKQNVFAVNSCLVPVYKCHGWSIKTVEGVGDASSGYHDIQARLASNYGTQCGYCSPGFIMNMYSLMQEKQELTMREIENSFGGNICRCTGYRPILDTFKSFAKDAPTSLIDKCIDIEELSSICLKVDKNCSEKCKSGCKRRDAALEDECSLLKLNLDDGSSWYRLTTLREIFEVLNMIDDENYMFVGGNTAYGVYRPTSQVLCYIDVKGIRELSFANVYGSMLVVGANLTLTAAMEYFDAISNKPNFAYAKQLAKHIDLVANIPVRNTGTIAGNLMIKHQHREFPSDIFLILETIGATLTIVDSYGVENRVALVEFLHTKMFKKVITKIILPARRSPSYYFKTYKVMPRAQNAHAYVNAGFLFSLNDKDKFRVLERPRIVFGGINPDFVHAMKTEEYLVGKQLLDLAVIQEALTILEKEVKPNHVLPDASPEYRKGLAVSLLYKFILSLFPDALSPKIKSGGELLERPLSSGSQDFDTDENLWPVNKPVPKLEAYMQCSGEAQYVNDLQSIPGELFAAIVIAEKGPAESFTIDAKAALKIPGVYGFYSAKDIPGNNNFMSPRANPAVGFTGEEVFASKNILFNGQALGAMLAVTQAIALQAVELVNVQYHGVKKPILQLTEVVDKNLTDRITEIMRIDATDKKDNVKHTISGRYVVEDQYHYTMETQTCVCVPNDEGLDVYSVTQNATDTLWTVANVLNVKEHTINVVVKRIGGGYGGKLTRSPQFAAICALGARLSQCAVRLVLPLETNMRMVGKRNPALVDYHVDVDDNGKIQKLEAKVFEDFGALTNEFVTVMVTLAHFPNAYDSKTWTMIGYSAKTDKTPCTWCRGPGSTEAIAMVEHIMEHIANVTKKDPLSVRFANFMEMPSPVSAIVDALKVSSNYEERAAAIEAFNNSNRWRKRGMSLLPLRYPIMFYGRFHSHISIFGEDGSVVIFHGGVECGQGLNTKVAQVCAHVLDIPLHYVKIRALSSATYPNNVATGGSISSEGVAMATKLACEEINKRLEPIKTEMPDATWEEIVHAANLKNIDLHSSCLYKSGDIPNYDVNAACVTEIEIDVLTGEKQIVRCDILEDAGKSLNPQVDIGQIEGAYVMGLGYYLNEEIVIDPDTGKLLTDRTWTYKPPGAKDIPIDFRVTLLKNASNPGGVFSSKATGEPAVNLSVNATFAIRRALESARKDAGLTDDWFSLKNPVTCERVWLEGSTSIKDMVI